MDDLKDVLKVVHDRSIELDRMDDAVAEQIKLLEEKIHRVLNVSIFTPIDDHTELAFGKHCGKWHLLVVNDSETKPLSSASREVRVLMFSSGAIERLLQNGVSQMDEMIQTRHQAIDIANQLITVLEIAPK